MMSAAKLILLLLAIPTLARANPSTSASSSGGSSSSSSSDLYKILEVPRDSTQKDIKKAYRRLSLRHHPDKVPESERTAAEERFKKIGKAYDCLSDEKKREMYDRYGEAALDPNFHPGMFSSFGGGMGGNRGGGGGGPQPFTFSPSGGFGGGGPGPGPGPGPGGFSSFSDAARMFGMGGGMGGGGGPTGVFGIGGDGNFNIDLSHLFESMMRGQQGGGGGGPGSSSPFSGFGEKGTGSGHNFGGGGGGNMGQRSETRRPRQKPYERPFRCSLEDLADPKGRTKKLKVTFPVTDPDTGRTVSATRIYEVRIKPGWKAGTRINFPSREKDGIPPITFVLKEKTHPYLTRDGNDLFWKCSITPRQAERGAKLSLPLPDGETLTISTKDLVPTKNGERTIVPGKGMPVKGGPERGDLVIEFRIVPKEGQ